MTQPPVQEPPGRPLQALPIIGGLVVGVIVCWVWIAFSLILGLGTAYGSQSNAVAVGAVIIAGLPVLLGVLLLVRPRTRLLAAGFLMGLSIGMIGGAGVCASLFIPGLTA